MSLFDWFRGGPRQDGESAKWQRLRADQPYGWAQLFGTRSRSGKSVSLDSTLQLAAAWACIRLTALAVASLPLAMYAKKPDGGREEAVDHDLAELLSDSPNADQTGLEYWETMVGALCARGNACSERVYTGKFLSALQPINGRTVRVDGELKYRVWDRGKEETLPRDKVFHLKAFNFGGDEGLSPIACGVQSLGAALATDETTQALFANGLQQPLFIDSGQPKLTPEQRKDLRELFGKFAGSDNAAKVFVLEGGMKPIPFTLNPEDAQMLETRRFNVEEICRWFGVPPIVVGHAAEGQTMWGTGVESILLAWLVLGINPLCRRIEARIKKDLIPAGERRKFYAEFNREGLLQMDSKAKAEFLSSVTTNGLMSRNEGRAKMNLPRSNQKGADDLTVQSALVPIDKLGATPPARPN